MRPNEIAKVECPDCLHEMDRAACVEGAEHARPRGGDVTFCFHCGALLVFEADLQVRRPSEEEAAELGRDPKIQKIQRLLRGFIATRVPGVASGKRA
jgi:hypothetical protein